MSQVLSQVGRRPRRGDWMQTFTGAKFWPLDPRPEDVRIADIAHHLSLICRFGGAARAHYSVAQHSVIVAKAVKNSLVGSARSRRAAHFLDVFAALLHDAAEAYFGDVIRPIKHSPVFARYRRAEAKVHAAICRKLKISPDRAPNEIRQADARACATERRDVFDGGGLPWRGLRARAFDEKVVPVAPIEAERLFLEWFAAHAPTLDLVHEAGAAIESVKTRLAVTP